MNSQKRNIPLLFIISFLQGLIFYAAIPTIYRQHFGLSFSDIFLLESIFWIIIIFLEVPWGYFSDRFGYRNTLVLANLLFFLSKVIFYFSTSFPLFLAERILQSITFAGLSGCNEALLYESLPSSGKRQKYFGYVHAAATIGVVLASLYSPILIQRSIRLTSYWTMYPYALAAILTFFLIEPRKTDAKPKRASLFHFKNLKIDRKIFSFLVLAAVINEFAHSITVVLNQSQYRRCGLDIAYLGILYAILQVIAMASIFSYKISARIGKKRMVFFLVIADVLAGITLGLTQSLLLSVLSIAMILLATALFQPVSFIIQNDNLQDFNRATALSFYAVIMEFISAIINFFVGKIADISLPVTFLSLTVLLVVSGIFHAISMRVLEKTTALPAD